MEGLDDLKDLLHQNRGKAHGGLVQHQQLGVGHKGTAHGKHLLFAAGEGAGHLPPPLLEPGKLLVHPLHVGGDGGVGLSKGAHLQVFLHGHLLEDPPPLRDLGQTMGHQLGGGDVLNGLAQKFNGAGEGAQQAGDGLQGGGLAGAVGADEGDNLPLVHIERDVLDGVDGAVIDVDVVYLEHAHGVTPPSPTPGRP